LVYFRFIILKTVAVLWSEMFATKIMLNKINRGLDHTSDDIQHGGQGCVDNCPITLF
jgi:hypothetical protein